MPKIKKILKQLPFYWQLMRFDKPIGTLLLLWPTLWALWIAGEGQPSARLVWVFCWGVIVMRAAGCVINDYADREFDPLVERTRQRPLAAGHLTAKQALGLFVLLCICALLLLVQLPMRVWPWSLPAVLITVAYPFMKRFISSPQLVLGVAFSFSIPMVYIAFNKPFDWVFYSLFLVNFLWVLVFDTEYAMSDREDDLKIGVKSTAIYFGRFDKLIIGIMQLAIIAIWLLICFLQPLNNTFLIALLMVSLLFIYQQYLIKDRARQACFNAFINNGWVGGILWFGLVLAFIE